MRKITLDSSERTIFASDGVPFITWYRLNKLLLEYGHAKYAWGDRWEDMFWIRNNKQEFPFIRTFVLYRHLKKRPVWIVAKKRMF